MGNSNSLTSTFKCLFFTTMSAYPSIKRYTTQSYEKTLTKQVANITFADFSYYQAIVVQHNMMGKRKGCSVEYCRYVYATTHKLVDKSLVMGCSHGVEATISYLTVK